MFISLCLITRAQAPMNVPVASINGTEKIYQLEKFTGVLIDPGNNIHISSLPSQHFGMLDTLSFRKSVPRQMLLSTVFLHFNIFNERADSSSYFFYPGMHYNELELYEMDSSGALRSPANSVRKAGFLYLNIGPGQKKAFFVRMQFTRTDYNRINAKLIHPSHLKAFKLELSNVIYDKNTSGFILSGILVMMILFTLVNYLVSGRMEFFYNCMYSVCMFLLVFFYAYFNNDTGRFNSFFLSYFALFLLITGTIFYVQFTRCFLDTAIRYPLLDGIFRSEIWLLGIMMLLYTILHFFTPFVLLENYLEITMKIVTLVIGIIYIVIGMAHKDRLMNYLAIGNALQIQFSGISLIFILFGIKATNVFNSALFYFEIGIVVSVFFFLLGLMYKNRLELIERIKDREALKLAAEKKEFETKLAILQAQQDERNRISADMHDDLGAGMTTIRLYSELAKNKLQNQHIPEIEKISASADELLVKMNAIIWSMTSSNDSLGNTVAYIRSYALEYFENTGIHCIITLPERIPEIEVNGQIRRNLFLVVKEALNNIVKHSGATEVQISLNEEPVGLSLTIADNGKGIDFEHIRSFGNGLRNMQKRMEDLGIEFSIRNNNGTTIRLYRQTVF